jgi:hypothetical protein
MAAMVSAGRHPGVNDAKEASAWQEAQQNLKTDKHNHRGKIESHST